MTNQDFLNAIDIGGIASAVEGVRMLKAAEPETAADEEVKRVKTCCRACIANCGVIATVRDGRVIKLEGNPEDRMSKGRMCAKGLSGIQALYHPNRNKYPMKRVGARGEGKWKRISWEEALGTIADKLIEVKKEYGAESVFCSTGGGGNPEIWSIARFCNIFGTPNWFEPGCAQCYLPRVVSYTMMYGGVDPSIADSNALELYFDSEIRTLVLWGTDPSYSCPASGGSAVNDQRAKGVRTVVVDPRFTPDAAKADVWLPIRPGTDVALMMAWIRYILEKELYDCDFLMKWSNLPYLVDARTKLMPRAHVSTDASIPDTFYVWDRKTNAMQPLEYPWNDALDAALEGTFTVDGKVYKTGFTMLKEQVEEYTLERAAEICWLDAGKIEEAIRLFAENTPSGLAIGVAMTVFLILPARIQAVRDSNSEELKTVSEQLASESATTNDLQQRLETLQRENSDLYKEMEAYVGTDGTIQTMDKMLSAVNDYLKNPEDVAQVASYLESIQDEVVLTETSESFQAVYQSLLEAVGPSVAQGYYEDGMAAYRQEVYADAIQNLEKAYIYDAGNIDVVYNLANAYYRNGDYENAAVYYQEVIDNFPNTERANRSADYMEEINSMQ